jgi:hypothetical protein
MIIGVRSDEKAFVGFVNNIAQNLVILKVMIAVMPISFQGKTKENVP